MKIIYIGSDGPLSCAPLKALLRYTERDSFENEFRISAIVSDCFNSTHERVGHIPVIDYRSNSLESLAFQHNISLFKIQKSLSDVIPAIESCQADIIIVSCFAYKLPDSVLNIPRIGCFNIHPSLLPAFRGPSPLFWQFRAEKCDFGVSLHRMTSKFDNGNIIAQKPIIIPDGSNSLQAIELLAHASAETLLQALPGFIQGAFKETPQDETQASYQSFPLDDDFIVTTEWNARRMFNFICVNEAPGLLFICEVSGQSFYISRALSYQKTAYSGFKACRDKPGIKNNQLVLACSSGFIHCELAQL
ncbi:Phosphoribosylglycinamide formyltransferase [hydrothermal vent metagenome]|uniref:Phosphoribosylglycinamide formyltransferase n=1 Tax=hydrothermal vent metagenome TaxID=652676 RepID=A0A3B0XER3_9ZZZZ